MRPAVLQRAPPFVDNSAVVNLGPPLTRRGWTPGGVPAVRMSEAHAIDRQLTASSQGQQPFPVLRTIEIETRGTSSMRFIRGQPTYSSIYVTPPCCE